MSKKDIIIFYEDLSDAIMELYNVDQETAYNAIKTVNMDGVIKEIGNFVYHDVIEVWAETVWRGYCLRTNA